MDTRPQRATPIETSTPVAHGCDTKVLAETLATILRATPDHDACVDALREAAWAADEAAFVGVDNRGVCTWVSTGAFRAFISRTDSDRTLWTIAGGAAVQLLALGQSEAA